MKTRTTKKRGNILSVLVVFAMLMATLLTACSSGQATETPAKEEKSKTEVTEKTTEVEQTEEVVTPEPMEESTPKPEPTPEPTSEPTPVPMPDTESTLPGVEWIQTFNGIIDEPKLVVFNDSTNKKIILEDLQEVEFEEDDTLAVYIPEERGKIVDDYYFCFDEVNYYDSVVTMQKIPSTIKRDRYSSAVFVDLEFDGKPKSLYAYLKYMN